MKTVNIVTRTVCQFTMERTQVQYYLIESVALTVTDIIWHQGALFLYSLSQIMSLQDEVFKRGSFIVMASIQVCYSFQLSIMLFVLISVSIKAKGGGALGTQTYGGLIQKFWVKYLATHKDIFGLNICGRVQLFLSVLCSGSAYGGVGV